VKYFTDLLRTELPGDMHHILDREYLPWNLIKARHGDHPLAPLTALLDAYCAADRILDLGTLATINIPEDSSGCLRCGSCCAYLRPGAVSGRTYMDWRIRGRPVAMFYSPVENWPAGSSYNCWFHNGVRLRMCPFLMMNLNDGLPFCCIHHMGKRHRPGACSRFQPDPPACQTGNFVPVP
jgi:hypothetical protein